ncbi:MAG: hypothetical protein ACI3XP_05600 [Eubacteriales bacterium]
MKRILTVLLAILIVLPSAAGCEAERLPEDTSAAQPVTQTPVSDSGTTALLRENTPDGLPDDLNFNGETVVFTARNAYNKYVEGEDAGDIIWSSVHDANLAVDERLNIKREIVWGDSSSKEFAAQTANAILASTCENDIIEIDQYYGTSYAVKHIYANLKNTKYIDFAQPWWYNDYMEHLTVGNDALYFLGGDIAPLILAWASCTFINQELYRDHFGSPEEMYALVDEGKWTVDKMREMCQTVYQDLDSDNQNSKEDVLGFAASKGQSAVFASLCAGAEFSRREEDGRYTITANSEENIRVFEKIFQLYNETPGVYLYDYSASPSMNKDVFAEGRALFMNEYFMYAWDPVIREMEDGFGVIPRPKMDEEQKEYRTAMQDSMYLFTVPRTLPGERMDMISAVLEAQCAENYRRVFPAMFETALKIKYNRDEQNGATAARMIDLIYENMISDFAVVFDNSLANISNTVGTMIQNGQNSFASAYARLAPAASKGLKKIEDAFLKTPDT